MRFGVVMKLLLDTEVLDMGMGGVDKGCRPGQELERRWE